MAIGALRLSIALAACAACSEALARGSNPRLRQNAKPLIFRGLFSYPTLDLYAVISTP
jgi:hypothetical protein